MPSRYPIILLLAAQLARCASEHFLLSFNVGTMILVVAELVSVVEIKRCTCPDNKGKAANSTKSLILVTDLHMTWARQDLRQLKRMRMYFVAIFVSKSLLGLRQSKLKPKVFWFDSHLAPSHLFVTPPEIESRLNAHVRACIKS